MGFNLMALLFILQTIRIVLLQHKTSQWDKDQTILLFRIFVLKLSINYHGRILFLFYVTPLKENKEKTIEK